ncbi:MAG TPA: hypothetical protein DCZ69_08160 [Syntrophobacteraceae bacterium]|nr:hypothetical protein [Syntrophobacteraceae bacterium]
MAKFSISQLVKVIDRSSLHHDLIGSVLVIWPENGRFFYWLKFSLNPAGGQFGEEQLQAIA